jgi:hypothetical protein
MSTSSACSFGSSSSSSSSSSSDDSLGGSSPILCLNHSWKFSRIWLAVLLEVLLPCRARAPPFRRTSFFGLKKRSSVSRTYDTFIVDTQSLHSSPFLRNVPSSIVFGLYSTESVR